MANNVLELIVALQRRFGHERKRELYRMELRCRTHKRKESLQAFGMEVERLVQLAYSGENQPLTIIKLKCLFMAYGSQTLN